MFRFDLRLQTGDLATSGLAVAVEKTTYAAADVVPGGPGIRATLTAANDKPYYAKLGDAFAGGPDQNPLYAAEGSDGVIERQSGGSWVKATTGILVEGVREVVLTPGKTYMMIANLSSPIQGGTYRLRVFVRETSGGTQTLSVQSASFEVR